MIEEVGDRSVRSDYGMASADPGLISHGFQNEEFR